MPQSEQMTHERRLQSVETWQADHEKRCEARMVEIRRALQNLSKEVSGVRTAHKNSASERLALTGRVNMMTLQFERMLGQQDLLIQGLGIHAKETATGETIVKSKIIKFDAKLLWTMVAGAGGIGFTYKVLVPSLIEFLINVHHAITAAG